MFKKAESDIHKEEQFSVPSQVDLPASALSKEGASAASVMSILPKGARFEGTLRTPSSLRIDGEFKGSVITAGDAILAPGSRVEAEIQAQNVIVGGHHRGTLTARNRATLGDAARVVGTITCRGLVITEGAWFDGKLSMGPPPDSAELMDHKILNGN